MSTELCSRAKKEDFYIVCCYNSKKHSILINQSNYFFFWIFYNYFSAIFGSKEYIRKRLVLGGCSHSWLAISRLPVNYRLTRRRASPGQQLGPGTFCIINKIKTMLGTRLLLPGFRSSWIKHPSARNLTGSIYGTE